MNISELYFLNSIIDDEDIPFISRPSANEVSMLVNDAIKEGLINKRVLANEDQFTEDGARLTRRLMQYKEATKHVLIDNLAMGIIDDTQAVVIIFNPLDGVYNVILADSSDRVGQIVESIPLFHHEKPSIGTEVAEPKSVDKDQLEQLFDLGPDNHFRLTLHQAHIWTDELFIFDQGHFYRYDYDAQTLFQESESSIIDCLHDRMA
ncbi:MAG: DUF5081 family protein [Coriobacteriia bacterium]|nr:DUF5081 family protein [Coriobacteriia bacterium]